MKYPKIVLATGNSNKVEEMKALLTGLDITLIPSSYFPEMPEVIEDADSLAGNAQKKAVQTYTFTGLPAVADDTGLEVDALDGRPGVYSARYAGENATYRDNVDKLLRALKDVTEEHRSARFKTVIALKDDNETIQFFKGVCQGRITAEPKGEQGFGYDSVFQPEGFHQTFAEMSPDTKNSISHRGKALEQFKAYLMKFR